MKMTKKNRRWTSIGLLVILTCIGYPMNVVVGGETNSQEDAFYSASLGTINAKSPLMQVLLNASLSSGIPFCIERLAESEHKLDTVDDMTSLSNASVNIFMAALDNRGVICKRRNNAILVTTSEVQKIKTNPLDKKIPGFQFRGSHAKFLDTLRAHKIRFNVSETVGVMSSFVYDIDISDELSIRELLMHLASNYGVAWTARISKEDPTYEIQSSDGTVTKAAGSRLALSFQPSRAHP